MGMDQQIIGHIVMNKVKSMLSVYFIAGSQDCCHLSNNAGENLLYILKQALMGGISCFQFREKGKNSLENDPAAKRQLAIECQKLCKEFNAPFIINDDIDLALSLQADGIHVGQTDMGINDILLKTTVKPIIGLSINNLAQALANQNNPNIDYFGIGPIFSTQSKLDHSPVLGMEIFHQIREHQINKPCVAIGGITELSAPKLRQLGADGVAVISAITRSKNIFETIRILSGG